MYDLEEYAKRSIDIQCHLIERQAKRLANRARYYGMSQEDRTALYVTVYRLYEETKAKYPGTPPPVDPVRAAIERAADLDALEGAEFDRMILDRRRK